MEAESQDEQDRAKSAEFWKARATQLEGLLRNVVDDCEAQADKYVGAGGKGWEGGVYAQARRTTRQIRGVLRDG
jgi:hypothetical protein